MINIENCALPNWYSHKNFEKIGDLARYKNSRWQMCPTEDAQIHRLLFFSQLFLKVKAMFFFPGQISGEELQLLLLICWPKYGRLGGNLQKCLNPSNPARLPTKTKRVSYDFQDFVGCLLLHFENIHDCYVAWSFFTRY